MAGAAYQSLREAHLCNMLSTEYQAAAYAGTGDPFRRTTRLFGQISSATADAV